MVWAAPGPWKGTLQASELQSDSLEKRSLVSSVSVVNTSLLFYRWYIFYPTSTVNSWTTYISFYKCYIVNSPLFLCFFSLHLQYLLNRPSTVHLSETRSYCSISTLLIFKWDLINLSKMFSFLLIYIILRHNLYPWFKNYCTDSTLYKLLYLILFPLLHTNY